MERTASPVKGRGRLVKPLTGGVKNLILGVVEKSQLVIILCGGAVALRRSREGDGGHTHKGYFDRGGCETSPWGKEVFHGRKAGGGNFARISRK